MYLPAGRRKKATTFHALAIFFKTRRQISYFAMGQMLRAESICRIILFQIKKFKSFMCPFARNEPLSGRVQVLSR